MLLLEPSLDITLKTKECASIRAKIQKIKPTELPCIKSLQDRIQDGMRRLGVQKRLMPLTDNSLLSYITSTDSACIGVYSEGKILAIRILATTNFQTNQDSMINDCYLAINNDELGNIDENVGVFRLSLVDEDVRGNGLQYFNSLVSMDHAFNNTTQFGVIGHLLTMTDPTNTYSTSNMEKLGLKIITDPIQYEEILRQGLYTKINESYRRNNIDLIRSLIDTKYRAKTAC